MRTLARSLFLGLALALAGEHGGQLMVSERGARLRGKSANIPAAGRRRRPLPPTVPARVYTARPLSPSSIPTSTRTSTLLPATTTEALRHPGATIIKQRTPPLPPALLQPPQLPKPPPVPPALRHCRWRCPAPAISSSPGATDTAELMAATAAV